jgi:hypothetical protein
MSTRGCVFGSIRLAIGVAALLLARVASAGFIGVEDDRLIVAAYGYDSSGFYQSAAPSSPFADFDAAVGTVASVWAVQDSTVTYDLLAGSGSILSGYLGSAYVDVRSVYDVSFDVDVATAYRLTGTLDAAYLPVSIALSGASTIFQAAATFGPRAFDHAGVLEPGRYRLVVGATFGGYGSPAPKMSYQFAMTPEPHPALLLGLGLLGLARLARGSRPPTGSLRYAASLKSPTCASNARWNAGRAVQRSM